MWAAFPDIRVEIEHLGVEDDVAVLHFRVRGTHEGEFMGAAPTGNHIDVEVMTFLRFGPEGKIVERWNRMDEVGQMTQLAAGRAWEIPTPLRLSPAGGRPPQL
jgi:predicted ester cyclase